MSQDKGTINAAQQATEYRHPSFREALRFWMMLGLISFGGPAAQIALLQREVVERRRWIDQERFNRALNFCMLIPGPEAHQLVTYTGWLLHGVRGGIVAGSSFVLPAVLLLLILSYLFVQFGELTTVKSIFWGLQCAVLAIVLAAAYSLARRSLSGRHAWILCAIGLAGGLYAIVPIPFILMGAGIVGFLAAPEVYPSTPPQQQQVFERPSAWGTLLIWLLPLVAIVIGTGFESTMSKLVMLFTKSALISFGGAYTVLPYITERAVTEYQWLSMQDMMAGLGLAETTPGPLIIVLVFVGFIAGWNVPEGYPPLLSAFCGGAIAAWATFVPSFVYVFIGAPLLEVLGEQPRLRAALAGISAAVVGLIVSMGMAYGFHLYRESGILALTVSALLLIPVARRSLNVIAVIVLAIGAGLVRAFVL